MFFPIYLFVAFFIQVSYTLPDGAPAHACDTMMPFHSGGIAPQTSTTPFGVFPAVVQLAENTPLRVSLGSQQGVQFGGFMMHARLEVSKQPVGTFIHVPQGAKTLSCDRQNDTVTHTSSANKGPLLEFEWMPPPGFRGNVIFNATVAQNYATFWVGIESQTVQVMRSSEITNPLPSSSTSRRPSSTTPPNFTPNEGGQTGPNDDRFYTGCFSEKGCFGAPDGCVATKNCKIAVATIVKGESYEFELKAPQDAAWVAFGLSDDNKMGDDSVVECVKDQNGKFSAFMSRNLPNDKNVERLSRPKDGINLLEGNMVDGQMYCRIARNTKTNVSGRIYDLVNEQYYLLVASGRSVKANKVGFHDIAYLPSGEKKFLADVSEVAGASKLLLRLHGAFMLAAWIGTASVGILLARYYRQTWVGKQMCGKDQWFAWHRYFMVLTWSLTMAAFILIFVELKAWSSERNPHAILGTVTTIVCFLQPIGAFFRPHPGTPRRPIFNWLHWLGGNVAHTLGIVTIFFAVKLNKAELPDWMDWILVAYVAFHVAIHLILSILGCISDRAAETRITSMPMKELGTNGRTSHSFERSSDAPKSGARKVILGLYLFVIILFVAVMIVVIVLAPIEESWAKLKKTMTSEST